MRRAPSSTLFPYTTLFRSRITRWLSTSRPAVFTAYAMATSFATYFCMYAFRKPFSAAQYAGLKFVGSRSEEHTSELQSQFHLVCRLLLEKKKKVTSSQLSS